MIKIELQDICTADNTPVSLATDAQKDKAAETSRAKFLAALMLSGADRGHFGVMRDELVNNFAKGDDSYPLTMEEVLHLMNGYKSQRAYHRFGSSTNEHVRANGHF
jgi:hypothetical protein